MNIQTGNITPVIPWENLGSKNIISGELSHDGKTVFYVELNKNIFKIFVQDLETGIEKELYRFDNHVIISLSPDGKWLACSQPLSLNLMPVIGGESKELYRFKPGYEQGRPITWSADGKYIIFSREKSGQNSWELCRIPVDAGEPQKLGLEVESGFINLSAHPNGRNIVFSSSKTNTGFWVMENFLPKTKDKK